MLQFQACTTIPPPQVVFLGGRSSVVELHSCSVGSVGRWIQETHIYNTHLLVAGTETPRFVLLKLIPGCHEGRSPLCWVAYLCSEP